MQPLVPAVAAIFWVEMKDLAERIGFVSRQIDEGNSQTARVQPVVLAVAANAANVDALPR